MPLPALALALALAAAQAPAPAGAAPPPAGARAEVEPEAAAPLSRRYVVERLRLDGLTRTRPSEVRRHLAIAEGEVLDEGAVLFSRLRLLQLGWFSRVETRLEKGSARGLVVLVFEFTERNTLVVSDLVVGSTGPQPLYGGLGLSQGNFMGLGLTLSGAFVYGGAPAEQPLAPARFALRGAFWDPELALSRLPLVFGLSAIALRGEELACGDAECAAFRGHYGSAPRLRYDRLGAELSFGLRPGPFERAVAGYRLERVGAERLPGAGGAPPALDPGTAAAQLRPGRSWLSALTGSYERDTRNDPFFPTDGSRLSVNVVLGSEALGGSYEYGRFLVQAESDHEPVAGHMLRLLGAAGAVQGDAPFFERFYAADFAYFSVGPALGRALELNFSTDARYDAYLALLGAEWGVPLWRGGAVFHRGYLALGARFLHTMATPHAGRTPASRTPFSGDVALRLDTPVGTFNVSLGYALDNFL